MSSALPRPSPRIPRELATGPVILPFYDATEALLLALEATGGEIGPDGARLREALARVEADLPDGHVRLDGNRQGVRDATLARVAHDGGLGVLRSVRTVHEAEQTFGGILASAAAAVVRRPPLPEGDAAALGRRALIVRAGAARASR